MEERGWEYRRGQPEGTVLHETVRDKLATPLAEAGELGRGLPRYVERDFARYLECGVLAHGVARVRCELQVLLKVSQLLSSPGSIEALLERILDLVLQIMDAASADTPPAGVAQAIQHVSRQRRAPAFNAAGA